MFQVGQRVVCINSSPGAIDGVKHLVSGRVYEILGINDRYDPPGLIVDTETAGSWICTRFRPIDDQRTDSGFAILEGIRHRASNRIAAMPDACLLWEDRN